MRFSPTKTREAPVVDVTPTEAWDLANDVRIIDVREPDEWCGELGHIPGAALVPLSTLEDAAAGWNHHEPVVLVCRSGGRSARAAATLARLGFRDVRNLAGGMSAYTAA